MSDQLLSISITLGLLSALALWVPALDWIERLLRSFGRHKP